MSARLAKILQNHIDKRKVHLSIAGDKMLVTKTVLDDDELGVRCGRYGTTLGGSEEPIRTPISVKKGFVFHTFDYEGEAVSLHFGPKKKKQPKD